MMHCKQKVLDLEHENLLHPLLNIWNDYCTLLLQWNSYVTFYVCANFLTRPIFFFVCCVSFIALLRENWWPIETRLSHQASHVYIHSHTVGTCVVGIAIATPPFDKTHKLLTSRFDHQMANGALFLDKFLQMPMEVTVVSEGLGVWREVWKGSWTKNGGSVCSFTPMVKVWSQDRW